MTWDVTKLSTKGQLVIPESIRIALGLKPGDIFTVRVEPDKRRKKIVLRLLKEVG